MAVKNSKLIVRIYKATDEKGNVQYSTLNDTNFVEFDFGPRNKQSTRIYSNPQWLGEWAEQFGFKVDYIPYEIDIEKAFKERGENAAEANQLAENNI